MGVPPFLGGQVSGDAPSKAYPHGDPPKVGEFSKAGPAPPKRPSQDTTYLESMGTWIGVGGVSHSLLSGLRVRSFRHGSKMGRQVPGAVGPPT